MFLKTEVLPEELPILFSNSHIQYLFSEKKVREYDSSVFNHETIPLLFNIPKNDMTQREMSLVHPMAQIAMFSYTLKYETLITSFCSQSKYSVRSPIKRNLPKISNDELEEKTVKRINEEFNLMNEFSITTEEINKYYEKYYSYNKYKKIGALFDASEFNRDKVTFDFFLKMDIQNFFSSIYTHSLSWAIYGSKYLGKVYRNEKDFANHTDAICSRINHGETNGIVIGPEFSRVISEILLTRVDILIYNSLLDKGLKQGVEYKIYRYIDDYYIFSNTKEILSIIEKKISENLIGYNLMPNKSKKEIKYKPMRIGSEGIISLKRYFGMFDINRNMMFLEYSSSSTKIEKNEILGKKFFWQQLHDATEQLVIKIPNERYTIIRYFLRTIASKIPSEIDLSNRKLVDILKTIIELLSNVYVLGIDSLSTNYYLQSLVKIYNLVKNEKNILNENSQEILELIHQNLYSILKNEIDKITYFYDLLPFLKMLDSNIPSNLLCHIIEENEKNYFVLCSVGKYVLNNQNDDVRTSFITVQKKLEKTLNHYFDSYEKKNEYSELFDSEYFYLLNDFSKYPGFSETTHKKFEKKLNDEIEKIKTEETKSVLRKMSSRSFYRWDDDTNTYVKKLIKKSSFILNKIGDY